MKAITITLVTASLVLAPAAGLAQAMTKDGTPRAAVAPAEAALATFGELVTRDNFRALGFDSPEQVKSATLGTPVRGYFVRLDALQRYEPGDDAVALIGRGGKLTFPVEVDSRARSSVTLVQYGEKWVAHSFGAPSYMQHVEEVRAGLAAREDGAPGKYFEVEIPALKVVFVGRWHDGEMLLSPVVDDARFGLTKGSTLTAADAFGRLAEAARSHDGLPG